MNAQQLKNSIIQYAMEGKLIKSVPLKEDSKAQNLNLIETKAVDQKLPFEIPSSWSWIPLKELGIIQTGNTPSTTQTEYYNENYIPFIKPGDFYADGSLNFDNQYLSEKGALKSRLVESKSIMMVCIGGSRGKCSKVTRKVAFNQQINTITPNSEICDWEYLFYVLSSDYFQKLMQYRATGTATPIINKSTWSNFLIPLPSLEEQLIILNKIKELEEKVGTYDKLFETLKSLQEKFPIDLEKSILQWSMQGELVNQNATDEPASVLLEKVKEEKEKLVKQKIIKKGTALPPITGEEIPFEIPESWKWVRLNDICTYIQRGKSPKYSEEKEIPVISQKCIQWSGFNIAPAKFIDPKSFEKYEKIRHLQDGDILWNSTGLGTVGRVAIYRSELNSFPMGVVDSHVTIVRCSSLLSHDFIYYYLSSYYIQSRIHELTSGSTKQQELNTSTVKSVLIPIPPVKEQIRIISKIKELISITRELQVYFATEN